MREYHTALNKDGALIHARAQTTLKNAVLCERGQMQKPSGVWFHLCRMSRGRTLIEMEADACFPQDEWPCLSPSHLTQLGSAHVTA